MAGDGADAMLVLPSALNVKVKKFKQAQVNGGSKSADHGGLSVREGRHHQRDRHPERDWLTVALTGNGGLGFDSGEGAWETATTSKEGSRRANYPILTQGGSDKI